MLIRNAMIHNAVEKEAHMGDIRVLNGKIEEIGKALEPVGGEAVIDATGLSAYPGFVDAHCHIGLDNYGGSTAGPQDYNEKNDIITPQLRGIDSYYPLDAAIPKALEGGVTCVGTGPGSANVLGGTFFAVKLYGNSVDKACVKNPVAMKCAFGENPKRVYQNKCNSARMTVAAKLREALFTAREYMLRKEAAGDDFSKQPKFDMKLEALIPVLKKEIPLKAHAHRADDILTAVRIAKEFDVLLTIEHCTEGHLIVEELVEAGYPVAVGPTFSNAGKLETVNKTWETPGILQRAGLSVSIITDAPVTLQQNLPLCAAMAIRAGMDPFEALKAITINPAKHLGIADRVGSLEAGKDADILLMDGDCFSYTSKVRYVIVDGKVMVQA